MYRAYCDGVCFYNDAYSLEDEKLESPVVTKEVNAAGSFEFTLPQTNVAYNLIEKMASTITVYRGNTEIFSGRPVSGDKDFWNRYHYVCEGELSYLNDTIQPPAKYTNQTPEQFLQSLIAVHNAKADEDKQFEVGTVTVTDTTGTTTRLTNYESTLECINQKLVEELEGYIVVRKVNGVRYIDYLSEAQNASSQEIRFGENLIDYTQSFDMAEIATVIIPTGERLESSPIEELEAYLTVASVNGGSIYVQNEEAVANLGWIEKRVEWSGITSASELLAEAQQWLQDEQFDDLTLEINAVNLHMLNPSVDSFELFDNVHCVSRPHGMDRYFPVTKITLNLDNPSSDEYILGNDKPVSLSAINSTRSNNVATIQSSLNTIINAVDTSALKAYPVGSIYMSVNNTSPAELFGGTWEQLTDRFLLAAGNTYTAGTTGGSAKHTHKYGIQVGTYHRDTIIENDSNAGALVYDENGNVSMSSQVYDGSTSLWINGGTESWEQRVTVYNTRYEGNTSYVDSLPPYLSVYMWKRIA